MHFGAWRNARSHVHLFWPAFGDRAGPTVTPPSIFAHMIPRPSALAVLLMFAAACVSSTARAQEEPLFPGADHLDTCLVDLPFSSAKKVKPEQIEAARLLEEQELVYFTFDKKKNKGLYTRVYVMIDANDDGSEYMYLETSEDHRAKNGMKQSFMPKFSPRSERFYDAQCFDRELVAHPELKSNVAEAEVMKAH
jgi:hypothetical protein